MDALAVLPDGIVLRRAVAADLAGIVALLADDDLGAGRESPDDLRPYLDAFARLDADPAHLQLVADDGGAIVATLQLTLLPGLARRGATRAQIEGVRVGRTHRGRGLGHALLSWAVAHARERGCALVQLTTDRTRTDAHRFYASLGFEATHDGLKLRL